MNLVDPGQNVWISDRRSTGKILEMMLYPRSCLVQSGKRVYKRNRKHLIPTPDFHVEPKPEDNFDVTGYQQSSADYDPRCPPLKPVCTEAPAVPASPKSPKTLSKRASSCTKTSPVPYRHYTYVTRSGKTVRPRDF